MVLLILFSLTFILLSVMAILKYTKMAEQSHRKTFSENDYSNKNDDTNFLDFSGGMLGI